METQTNTSESKPFAPFQKLVLTDLKIWLELIYKLCTDPKGFIEELPRSGPWRRPLFLALISGVIGGIVYFVFLGPWNSYWGIRWGIYWGATDLIRSTALSVVIVFVGGFIINAVLSFFGKDPKLYRTVLLLAVVSIANPVVEVLARVSPFAWLLIQIPYLWLLFLYARIAARFTKNQAIGLIAILGVLTITSFGALSFIHSAAFRPPVDYHDHDHRFEDEF